ncbi:hypothetical protein CC1G_04734 [Coprinopsis cinerea okayama7|uniref:Protein CPL1-like domain-containing protein n=1 Tax=Coprinopsis cinerea (strain Okayama-7 / 130 / ATCC MYA-4618 / FGSC 9003) TaxID=240176 RepID=A8P2D0_COPC7|nr:hypothetical protein CC1G_04734 [Coprinopsis cinerea okayama7\|eukprot:XP_001838290.1 hypothetical protein CC1G_04734 [Coprinopsis cinerea okayama7\
MKAVLATLFAFSLFSAFSVTLAEPINPEKRTWITCPKHCKFPPHSTPLCTWLNPCGFICKDGYIGHPLLNPKSCVCKWPFTECNGKCGLHKACPSKGYHKRELTAENAKCPTGFTACGILGRHAGSWECVDTQRDLESCGGCMVSLNNDLNNRDGQDCTAIQGVDDVACVQGQCKVNKCMDGYTVSESGTSCTPVERKNFLEVAEEVLRAQFAG